MAEKHPQFYKYYCTKVQHYLSREERKQHDCFHRNRSKRNPKGKPCHCLVKLPVLQDEKKGGEKLD